MSEGTAPEKTSIQDLVKGVFADFMSIITEDIVLEAHRTEKLTNMGYFSQDGVPVTTQELQMRRGDEPELLSAMVMGRSTQIPVEDNICQKCQHPIQQNLETSLTAPVRKYCPKPPYRVVTGQDMYGKAIASNTIQIPKTNFKPKVQAALDSGSRQSTPAIGEENGKLPPVKDPQGFRLPCPSCGVETSFKLWIPKHKACLGYTDKKPNTNNGDSGSGTPLSPDSPTSSFAEGENPAPTKKKKSQSEPKPPPKKLQTKKEASNAGESIQKGSITSAPRLEKSLSTASNRADSPTSSTAVGSQSTSSANAGTKKKKQLLKRKAENIDEDADKKTSLDPYDIDSHPVPKKEKDVVSITPTKPNKKQKTSNTPTSNADAVRISPHPGTPTTKNLVSKFKDRTGSPTPTKKDKLGGVDLGRSHSDSSATPRKSSPKPSSLGDKDSKPKKVSKPDSSPNLKKLTTTSSTKVSKKDASGKMVPHKKKEKRPTPDRA
ncbi:hypothetical protein H072_5605 [Dactylellina haptotyla CBS 200.50]|uniref:SAGA-associated factor 11 n=1 Tax=Dactylellina haptotyla (strain CBS 200.50) TaxID=1284197 RepID=S8AC64_DACHA|nr:hypothetical protein H072_5605 [Dactylellina haptotyla CBS 200.50]